MTRNSNGKRRTSRRLHAQINMDNSEAQLAKAKLKRTSRTLAYYAQGSRGSMSRHNCRILRQLFDLYWANDKIHNSVRNITPDPQIKIPLHIKLLFALGFGFIDINSRPSQAKLVKQINETLRKLGCHLYYQLQGTPPTAHQAPRHTDYAKVFRQIQKENEQHFGMLPIADRSKSIAYENLFHLNEPTVIQLIQSEQKRYSGRKHPWVLGRLFLSKLAQFCERNHVLFLQADKGAGVVMWTINQYQTEAARQLMDQAIYTHHRIGGRLKFETEIKAKRAMARRFDRLGVLQMPAFPVKLEHMIPQLSKCRPSKFRMLVKLQKEKQQETGTYPGRPISSSIKTPTRGISKIFNQYLVEIQSHLPNICIDSLHLMNQLAASLPQLDPATKYLLVKGDIKSMYTVLKHRDVRSALQEYFKLFGVEKMYFPLTKVMISLLLEIVLRDNFLTFNEGIYIQYYQQHSGLPMGHSSAQYLANITVSYLLKKQAEQLSPQCKSPTTEIIFQTRLLDDFFLIIQDVLSKKSQHDIESARAASTQSFVVSGSQDHQQQLPGDPSAHEDKIQFVIRQHFTTEYLTISFEMHPNQMPFLDVAMTLFPGLPTIPNKNWTKENQIQFQMYRNPIAQFTPIHYKSNMPPHLLSGIVYSQGIRIIRNNSYRSDANTQIAKMIKEFKSAGYPNKQLSRVKGELDKVDRAQKMIPRSTLMRQMMFNRLGNEEYMRFYKLNDVPTQLMDYKIPRPTIYPENTLFNVTTFYNTLLGLPYTLRDAIKENSVMITDEELDRFLARNQITQLIKTHDIQAVVGRLEIVQSFRLNENLGSIVNKINKRQIETACLLDVLSTI